MKSEFSQKLKDLRHDRGWEQKDLAQQLNVSKSTISAWEIGRNQPSYELLSQLANLFDVTTDYLLGLTDDWGNVTLSAGAISSNNNTVNSHNTINSAAPTTPDEAELLRLWKKAPPDKRAALLKL